MAFLVILMYGKPLLLPEEVMEEPHWKIARFTLEDWAAKVGNRGLYNGPSLSAN